MNERVLVVDDDRLILFAMQRTRKRLAYHLDTAGSAREALEMIRQRKYAVLVTDYEMPGLNGLELLAKCRDQTPETIAMVLSATEADHLNQDALAELVFRFIKKPCLPTMMASFIQDGVLEHRRAAIASLKDATSN